MLMCTKQQYSKRTKKRLRTFNVLSHVIVNDHGDILDIDTSTSNVCGHQDVFGSSFEVGEGKLSLLLAFTTMKRAGIVLWERVPQRQNSNRC